MPAFAAVAPLLVPLFLLLLPLITGGGTATALGGTPCRRGSPARHHPGGERPTRSGGFSAPLTLLWAQMAEPRSFHVPPLRSMRSMRRICRKRRLRSEVASTLPWFPTATTGTEAISTKMSGSGDRGGAGGGREGKEGQAKAVEPSQPLAACSPTRAGHRWAKP